MNNFYQVVTGWSVTNLEREWLRNTALNIENQFNKSIIVNIGVLHGATMHCLRAGASSAQLFGVDIDYTSYPVQKEKLLRATMIKGNSNICHANFHNEIHFLFIDGDHQYLGVKADIAGWSPKIVVGGVIGFHDYINRPPKHLAGVKKAIDEWIALEHTHWKLLQSVNSIRGFRRIS